MQREAVKSAASMQGKCISHSSVGSLRSLTPKLMSLASVCIAGIVYAKVAVVYSCGIKFS